MRMWYGREKEGACTDLTLFVESATIDTDTVKRACQAASSLGIRRVYFGAGRIDPTEVNAQSMYEFDYQKSKGFTFVVETSPEALDRLAYILKFFSVIILRAYVAGRVQYSDRYRVKLDNGQSWCAVTDAPLKMTPLAGLKDGLYADDKEVTA